jgi:hypothetical protein
VLLLRHRSNNSKVAMLGQEEVEEVEEEEA